MLPTIVRWRQIAARLARAPRAISFAGLDVPEGAQQAGQAKPGPGHDPTGVRSASKQKQKEAMEKIKEVEETAGMHVSKVGRNALMGPNGYDERLADPALRWCLPARPVPAVAGRVADVAVDPIKVPLCSRQIADEECDLAMVNGELKVGEADLDLSPPYFTGCKHPLLKEELRPGAAKKVKGFLFKCPAPAPNTPEADREGTAAEMTDQQEAEELEKEEEALAEEGIGPLPIVGLLSAHLFQVQFCLSQCGANSAPMLCFSR